MYQNYNYYQPQSTTAVPNQQYQQQIQYQQPQIPYTMRQPQQLLGLKGRPVSSLEEVKASAIDFDGSIFYFPDLANQKIYTKQINMDGTATLNVYEIINNSQQQPQQDFVTREEFEKVITQLQNMITIPKQQQSSEKEELKFF